MTLAVAVLQEAGTPIGGLLAAAALVYPFALVVAGALRPAEVRDLLNLRRGEKIEPEG